jgi:hypothetical protein
MSEEIVLDAEFLDELETALNNEEIFQPAEQTTDPSSQHEIIPSVSNSAKTALVAWLIAHADIPSSKASVYSDLLTHSGILTIKKIVKNLKKDRNYLAGMGVSDNDSAAIVSALIKENLLDSLEDSSPPEAVPQTPLTSLKNDLEKSVHAIRTMLQEVIDAQDSFTVEKLAKDACKEIINVANATFDGQFALGKAGVCEDLVVLITIYTSSSPRVLQRALCALCALCRRKMDDRTTQCFENITLLGEVRACQVTISALRKYEDDLVIIKWAAGAIRNLCSLDLNRTRFGTSGACQSLMQIAKKYETNEDVLRWIFRAMGNLVNGNNENRTSLIHHGFCEFIIPTMKSHQMNALVLADSCWAIRSVALGDAVCREQLVELKACDIIAENLKRHFHVDFLISEGCLALLALTAETETVMTQLAHDGACYAFTLPLLGTSDSTHILSTHCCGEIATVECLTAIHAFALNDPIRNHFFDAGAGEACAVALRAHSQSVDVAIWVCKALYKLSLSQSSSKKLRRAHVCEAIVTLLSNDLSRTHPEVAEWAGLCASILAIDRSNREILAKNKIGESVVRLLQIHEKNPDVAYRICGAVHFLSIDDTIRSQLGALGACEIVTSVLRTHTLIAATSPAGTTIHEGAVQASCRALGSLACDNILNNSRFADCHVSEVLCSAFTTFHQSPAMVEFCCRAVSRVCANAITLSTFSQAGGCQCVITALVEYVETDAVVKHALLAAMILTTPHPPDDASSPITRDNIKKFREAQGALVSAVRAFELHSASQSLIAQTGSTVFRHLFSEVLIDSFDSFIKKIAMDACRAMLSSMTPHLKSAPVQIEVISAIEVVSRYGVSESLLGEMNYPALLIATLVQHSADAVVVKLIFQTMSRLIDEPENIHHLCNTAGCAAILKALKSQSCPELIM